MSDLHHLAAAYALDALDGDERRAFEAHYPSCDICTQEVADFRGVANALAETTATSPPDALKAKVMAEIAATRQLSPLETPAPLRRSNRPSSWIIAAAATLVVLGGLALVALRSPGGNDVLEVVEAFDAVTTELNPTEENPSGWLRVHWSADQDQVAVIGQDLDDVSAERAYALWFIFDDGSVAPAGLFRPDDGFYSDVLDVDDRSPTTWGISIEPASGSPQPTTPVLFAGDL